MIVNATLEKNVKQSVKAKETPEQFLKNNLPKVPESTWSKVCPICGKDFRVNYYRVNIVPNCTIKQTVMVESIFFRVKETEDGYILIDMNKEAEKMRLKKISDTIDFARKVISL